MTRRSPFDIPAATYRLQLHRDFTFEHAGEILPYLARLGISHVYCSPFLQARAGSSHGYDIVDYTRINPELGGEAGFDRFCAALEQQSLGLILDFVPNHMGIGHADNAWWLDVLEWGEASPYSRHFDIDWSPPRREMRGKLLVPVLGKSYGDTLSAGEIELRFDAANGSFDFWYFDHRLPLSPRDYPAVLGPLANDAALERGMRLVADAFLAGGQASHLRQAAIAGKDALSAAARDPALERAINDAAASWQGTPGDSSSYTRLHELLQRQAYRLANWRTASDEINYRRFFDIEDLAGVRMDRVIVFREAHQLVGQLLSRGLLHGLRIDHVDGLADPQHYCRRLNAFAAAIVPRDPVGRRLRPYILVEKILADGEALPPSWPVSGTTGYDYLALVNGLFIDSAGYTKLQRHWSRFTGLTYDVNEEIDRCRRLIIDRSLGSEMTYLVHRLVDIAQADWFTRDFTQKRLRDALVEIVAAFAVYRTYVTERGLGATDRHEIAAAIERARARWSGADAEILDFVGSVLTLDIARSGPGHYAATKPAILRFIARFQQYTGAVAAKAVEDTFFYRHVPLASANEVGASPLHPATSVEKFHAKMAERATAWPHAMLASATHDTKRGEDMRARLDVLSEMPDEWARRVARWHIYNRAHRQDEAPSRNDEYLLYQSIVGTWPMQAGRLLRAAARRHAYVERLKAYAIKACREAKLSSSWAAPNAAYEAAFLGFIDKIFAEPWDGPFIDSLTRFLPPILRLGAFNALTQLVFKATLPGVPDFYQGSEFWDLSLVDPDNRWTVDYRARAAALDAADFTDALSHWRDGWLKSWTTHRLLDLRQRLPALFSDGAYRPLAVEGRAGNSVIAFERRTANDRLVVVGCRFLADHVRGDLTALWPDLGFLADTAIRADLSGRWRDQISGATVDGDIAGIGAGSALAALPVAALLAD